MIYFESLFQPTPPKEPSEQELLAVANKRASKRAEIVSKAAEIYKEAANRFPFIEAFGGRDYFESWKGHHESFRITLEDDSGEPALVLEKTTRITISMILNVQNYRAPSSTRVEEWSFSYNEADQSSHNARKTLENLEEIELSLPENPGNYLGRLVKDNRCGLITSEGEESKIPVGLKIRNEADTAICERFPLIEGFGTVEDFKKLISSPPDSLTITLKNNAHEDILSLENATYILIKTNLTIKSLMSIPPIRQEEWHFSYNGKNHPFSPISSFRRVDNQEQQLSQDQRYYGHYLKRLVNGAPCGLIDPAGRESRIGNTVSLSIKNADRVVHVINKINKTQSLFPLYALYADLSEAKEDNT